MKRLLICSVLVSFGFIFACGGGGNSNAKISVVGVKSTLSATSIDADETTTPCFGSWNPTAQHISSGSPEYVIVTLSSIAVQMTDGSHTIWTGSKDLKIDGTTPVDVSDVNNGLQKVPIGTVQKVILGFKQVAKIKGSVTTIGGAPTTYYTKTAYPYDAVNHKGASSTVLKSVFVSSPSEEMDFYITGDSGDMTISTDSNYTIADATTPIQITLMFDINRLLRFYDGLATSSGFNPTDPAAVAAFSGHSLLGGWIAGFMGTPGMIEGYKTYYHNTHPGSGDVPGWMTIVYDASGKFVSGFMIGDSDNDLTVAKGRISSYTDAAGMATFSYDTSNETVTGFQRVATMSNYSAICTYTPTNSSQSNSGTACFQKLFAQ